MEQQEKIQNVVKNINLLLKYNFTENEIDVKVKLKIKKDKYKKNIDAYYDKHAVKYSMFEKIGPFYIELENKGDLTDFSKIFKSSLENKEKIYLEINSNEKKYIKSNNIHYNIIIMIKDKNNNIKTFIVTNKRKELCGIIMDANSISIGKLLKILNKFEDQTNKRKRSIKNQKEFIFDNMDNNLKLRLILLDRDIGSFIAKLFNL